MWTLSNGCGSGNLIVHCSSPTKFTEPFCNLNFRMTNCRGEFHNDWVDHSGITNMARRSWLPTTQAFGLMLWGRLIYMSKCDNFSISLKLLVWSIFCLIIKIEWLSTCHPPLKRGSSPWEKKLFSHSCFPGKLAFSIYLSIYLHAWEDYKLGVFWTGAKDSQIHNCEEARLWSSDGGNHWSRTTQSILFNALITCIATNSFRAHM